MMHLIKNGLHLFAVAMLALSSGCSKERHKMYITIELANAKTHKDHAKLANHEKLARKADEALMNHA